MARNGSDPAVLVMPLSVEERASQAWRMARDAKQAAASGVERATEAYFTLIAEVRDARAESNAREMKWQAWRDAITRQINALTHATRQVRASTSNSTPEEIRNELPTLPEIIVEEVRAELRRDSDRAQAKQMRTLKGWVASGVGKAVTAIVYTAIVLALGVLWREWSGMHH